MKFFVIIGFLLIMAGAMYPTGEPVNEREEETIEMMNTAPNPTPVEHESEEFRGSTIQKEIDADEIKEEEKDKKEKGPQE